jgi:hypothetical protein
MRCAVQNSAALRLDLSAAGRRLARKVRRPAPPPTFFCKNIIPNGLLARFMQGCDSKVFSWNLVGGTMNDSKSTAARREYGSAQNSSMFYFTIQVKLAREAHDEGISKEPARKTGALLLHY